MSMNNARKRRSFTILEKLELIRVAEEQERTSKINKTELSSMFNMHWVTVHEILQKKEKILQAAENGIHSKRSRIYPAKHLQIEEPLVEWAKQVRSRNDPVTGNLIKVSFRVYGTGSGSLKWDPEIDFWSKILYIK